MIDLTYTFTSGNTVALALGGNLQSGGNIFNIGNVLSFSLNGMTIADPFTIASTDRIYTGSNTSPVATINGSLLDLYVTDTTTNNAFAFAVGDMISNYAGNVVGASTGLGGDGGQDKFVLASFAATEIPEPAAWSLFAGMLVALGLITVPLRRRAVPSR